MATVSPPISSGSAPAEPTTALAEFLRPATALYTLPAVAAEVLTLTKRQDVDAAEMKACLERDPALTVKILRVVNSSLFGLSGQVSDLNQAIALLGVKPLELLVLAFSLPDQLFADVAREPLERYWRTTLIRAVAARDISQEMLSRDGDEAFLAGLLQDIGVLVLMSRIGEPYAAFLQQVVDDGIDLTTAELEALGFTHIDLSVALLQQWNMPELLVRAIAEPRGAKHLAHSNLPHAALAQALHLADLLSQLVALHRISVLPELTDAGAAYCGMTKSVLTELVGSLQFKVDALADVLRVPAGSDESYRDVLAAAQQQIASLVDEGVESLPQGAPRSAEGSPNLIGKTAMLQLAVTSLSEEDGGEDGEPVRGPASARDLATDYDQLTLAVGSCRAMRKPLSVTFLSVDGVTPLCLESVAAIRQILKVVCRRIEVEGCVVEEMGDTNRLILLPGCERHEALAVVEDVLTQLRTVIESLQKNQQLPPCVPSAGVASVGTPPKNFPPQALLETARRCQAAAPPTGGVKSLEIC